MGAVSFWTSNRFYGNDERYNRHDGMNGLNETMNLTCDRKYCELRKRAG